MQVQRAETKREPPHLQPAAAAFSRVWEGARRVGTC